MIGLHGQHVVEATGATSVGFTVLGAVSGALPILQAISYTIAIVVGCITIYKFFFGRRGE